MSRNMQLQTCLIYKHTRHSRIPLRAQQVFTPPHMQTHMHPHAHARARTHAHVHARTHARMHAHTHTHFLVLGTRVTMCSPTSRYPPATDESYIIHRTIALCSVCSFSSVLNGNVGCSAHLRTAAERHSPRFGFRERSVFQSDHHVQNKTKARTPLAHRTRRPRLT